MKQIGKTTVFVALFVLLLGTTGVLANPDYDVRVADRSGYAEASLADGAIVQYIGDENTTYGASGSGVFDPFVRLQGNEKKTLTQSGYNTDGTLEFDTKGGKWTHAILLSEIPTVLVNDNLYWEFWADINDNDNTPLISLDDFELYLTAHPTLSGYPFAPADAELIYDYTAANDGDSILINDVNQGSGRGDLRYLVPVSDTGADNCNYGNPACTTYLVLYSVWGGKGGDYLFDGGFEEWKVKVYPKLQVSKDIDGAYETPVTWTITKEANATYDLFSGESVVHGYEVSVDPSFGGPENTMVYGTITILGDDKDPVDATITDYFNGVPAQITACSVEANADGTYPIAAGSTVTCDYVLDLGDTDPVAGTNLARASYAMAEVSLGFQGSADIQVADYDQTLTGDPEITVDDDYLTGENWSANAAPASWTYQRTFTCDADEGTHVNTATINETGQSDIATVTVNCYELEVTKTADEFYSRYFQWDITKSVTPETWDLFTGESATSEYTVFLDQTGFYENDWQVTGEITIDNPHPAREAVLNLVEDDAGGFAAQVDCDPVTAGAQNSGSVPAGGSLVCSYETAVQDSVDNNPFGTLNTATATQQLYDFDIDGIPTADGTKDYSGSHAIDFDEAIVELVDEEATVSDTYAGSTVSGSYTGDKTFTYERTFSCDADEGTHDNTASFVTNDTPLDGSDDASVVVNCYDLTVSKTADEFYNTYFSWYIDKLVDEPGPITVAPGDSVALNYTVEVGLLSATDNDWQVTGDITIDNSHPSRAALLNLVADNAGGIPAVVDCDPLTADAQASGSVPAGGSLVCSYETAVQDSADSNPFGSPNIATATQQLYSFASDGSPTADGTQDYQGSWPIDFTQATVSYVDEQIDVDDSYAGFLGTVNALTDDLPAYFTYQRTETADLAFCGSFTIDNTATFETNDTGATGSDAVGVTIEVPCQGCTPGFWQGGAGQELWDDPSVFDGGTGDPQWPGVLAQPYSDDTFFNAFFNFNSITDPRLDGQTMWQLVSNEGGIANSAEKAARTMVAAYLNESAFPSTYPASSLADLAAMWYAAVQGGDADLEDFHTLVNGWNSPAPPGYCPLP